MSAVGKPSAAERLSGKRIKAGPTDIQLESFFRQRHVVRAPEGATAEDVRYPEFFAHYVRKIRRHDIVTVMASDEAWELEVCAERVLAAGIEVSVRKLHARVGTKQSATPVVDGYHTEHRAGDQWCIIRESDGHPIIQGHALEQSAVAQFFREQPRKVA